MQLPQFQFQKNGQENGSVFSQMQTQWAAIINKLLSRPQNFTDIIPDYSLASGDNVILHGLGHDLQGWSIIRINGAATIYDKQATNTTPAKTLVLNSSAAVTVTLEVF